MSGSAYLEGTLLTPGGSGPYPTVVLLGGSGWRTRNQVRRQADLFTQQAGNPRATLRVIPQADHGLRPVEPGVDTPLHRTTGYAPEVWPMVQDWLKNQIIAQPVPSQ